VFLLKGLIPLSAWLLAVQSLVLCLHQVRSALAREASA
jgi:hypothetical protein